MLTDKDVEMMKEWREEIVHNRRRPVILTYFVTEKDEITGEPIREDRKDKEVLSVVTEIDGKENRYTTDGVEYQKGDIQLSLSIEEVEEVADKITQITHDGKDYEILSMDRKGIGIRNRYEVLGRVIT